MKPPVRDSRPDPRAGSVRFNRPRTSGAPLDATAYA